MNEGIYIVQFYKLRNVYLNPKKFAYEIISWITGHKLIIYKFQLNNKIDSFLQIGFCKDWLIHANLRQKTLKYCEVISLQLKLIN